MISKYAVFSIVQLDITYILDLKYYVICARKRVFFYLSIHYVLCSMTQCQVNDFKISTVWDCSSRVSK